MNLILSFNEYNSIKNLTESELEAYNFILYGVNESNIDEGILNRIQTIARKGILTASVLTALMGNPTYAKEYKALPDADKDKIEQMVSSKDTSSANVKDTLLIKAGENFDSGRYKLSEDGKKKMNVEFQKVLDFMKDNPDKSSFIIRIISSESAPKNIDAETGKPLPRKELSRLRSNEMKNAWDNFIEPVIQKAGKDKSYIPGLKVEIAEPIVGTEKTNFKLDQYVNIEVKADTKTATLCSKIKNEKNKTATAATDYVSIGNSIPALNTYGKGTVVLKPGTVPDRLIIKIDGIVIGDTGFFINRSTDSNLTSNEKSKCSDKENAYKEWKYIPSYVAQLTTLSLSNPKATQDTPLRKLIRRKFSSYEELVKFMLTPEVNKRNDENKKKNLKPYYDAVNDHKGEIGGKEQIIGSSKFESPLIQLKNLGTVNGEWNSNQYFLFYDLNSANSNIDYMLLGDSKLVDYRVYSPLIQTGVSIEALCGI